jgi:sirohydrochlorin cobaltochelatase
MFGDYKIAPRHKHVLGAIGRWEPGLILFAHGAREAEWVEPAAARATGVRKLAPSTPVHLAFLELMQPDLRPASADLVATGLRRDLPEQPNALRAESGIEFVCAAAVGDDEAVL